MTQTQKSIGVLVVFALLVGGVILINNASSTESQADTNSPSVASNNDSGTTVNNNRDTEVVEQAEALPVQDNPGMFTEYSEAKLADSDGDVVLFFGANWCPTCVSLEKDINANSDKIPADLTIMRLEYNTNDELEEKYGVTYQHTLVIVDNEGNMIDKWVGGNDLESIVERV